MQESHSRKFEYYSNSCNVEGTQYEVVKSVLSKDFGWKLVTEPETASCHLIWSDKGVSAKVLRNLRPHQRINHFPGMNEICRKNSLAWNLARLQRVLPKDYSFFPKTWVLPGDAAELKSQPACTYIVKPQAASQGRGISILPGPGGLRLSEKAVVQEYIQNPLLLGGLKFDLRIYVLVTSVQPLQVYIHNYGLARFATEQYTHAPHSRVCAHLTNYAINKKNPNYTVGNGIDKGHKRSLDSLMEELASLGHDVAAITQQIDEIVVKTVSAAVPRLLHVFRSCRASEGQCFDLLGFDILLDDSLKAWLLEVNQSPSFHTGSALDWGIKRQVLFDAVRLVTTAQHCLGKFRVPNTDPGPYVEAARSMWLSFTGQPRGEPKRPNRLGASSSFVTLDRIVQRSDVLTQAQRVRLSNTHLLRLRPKVVPSRPSQELKAQVRGWTSMWKLKNPCYTKLRASRQLMRM